MPEIKLGDKVIEGKTKIVYKLVDEPSNVLLQSKDRITANNAQKSHDLEGKAAISTDTTCRIFELLQAVGIKSHYVRQHSDTAVVTQSCDMIPIEWVTRRVATGSFLKRNPGVKEGTRFTPVKLETFYKDDAAGDPEWSKEQILAAEMKHGGITIGPAEVTAMGKTTIAVFEILEKAWSSLDCSLIDMKIEFGVLPSTGEIVLADVIDSDSWRLWPAGDRRLMKDKQVYRELQEVTSQALDEVKRNFQWVADRVKLLSPKPRSRVAVFMGSPSDMEFCEKIRKECKSLGVPCELRISSAHKGTEETMKILAEYEGEGIPTVFVAVAGRSNGLGPVLSGNAVWPVINCPPVKADWAAQDVWSSLRLPSGLGCSTVISPEGAALQAAQILALQDHMVWGRLRSRQLYTALSLQKADREARDDK